MFENFMKSYEKTLELEGGYSDDERDPGGVTFKGVTLTTYSSFLGRQATKEELLRMTEDERMRLYMALFWNKVQATLLPSGVDFIMYDFAVNSGPKRPIMTLQAIVGARQDGIIGIDTVRKTNLFVEKNGAAVLINKFMDEREAFLKSLQSVQYCIKGLLNRTATVRKFALSLVKK